jgi:hypothetical protein
VLSASKVPAKKSEKKASPKVNVPSQVFDQPEISKIGPKQKASIKANRAAMPCPAVSANAHPMEIKTGKEDGKKYYSTPFPTGKHKWILATDAQIAKVSDAAKKKEDAKTKEKEAEDKAAKEAGQQNNQAEDDI